MVCGVAGLDLRAVPARRLVLMPMLVLVPVLVHDLGMSVRGRTMVMLGVLVPGRCMHVQQRRRCRHRQHGDGNDNGHASEHEEIVCRGKLTP